MTPTVLAIHQRHKTFHSQIAQRAALLRPLAKAIKPEAMPAETDPPKDVVCSWVERQKEIWFSIVDEIDPPHITRPTIGMIQRIVCRYYDITLVALISQSRLAINVRARQVAMFLVAELLTKSLPEIGRKFGNRDHTTALHGIRKIKHLEKSDADLAAELAELREAIQQAVR